MKLINVNDVETKKLEVDNPLFFGGKVHTQSVFDKMYPAEKNRIVNVQFAPGTPNKFHTHLSSQILWASKAKEYSVTPGMAIFISPGEVHWHGATNNSSLHTYQ